MTKEHMEAMRAGQERARERRHANSIARVQAFQAWVKREAKAWASGDKTEWLMVHRQIPLVIPTNYDYKVARGDA